MRVRNYSLRARRFRAGLRKPPCFSWRNSYLMIGMAEIAVETLTKRLAIQGEGAIIPGNTHLKWLKEGRARRPNAGDY
jgi:hypothetical protein